MDTSRVSPGELIAGAGGAGLFLFLFLDWFGPINAWEGFDIIDVILAIIGLGAAGVAVARAVGAEMPIPPVAVALGGFAATVMTLTFLLEGDERKIGIWLAFFASAAIAYGGMRAAHGGSSGGSAAPPPPPAA